MTASALAGRTPREAAGAGALRAFDFQMHVSIARILERHADDGDYFALFDHFDDLVMVENEKEGVEPILSFYQVKASEDKAWTAARLAKRPAKGDLPKSIIGKAYYNIAQFGGLVRRASILSNQPLHADLETGSKVTVDAGEVVLSTLCKVDYVALVKALKADFPGDLDPAHATVLSFERVPFDLQSFRDTVLGRVTRFIEKIVPGSSAVAKPFYDSIASEVTRCTGNKVKPVDLAELKARKGLDRQGVDALIDQVQKRVRTPIEWWPAVASELEVEGMKALGQRRIYNRCLAYWVDRERGTTGAAQLAAAIRAVIESAPYLIGDSVQTSASALILAGNFKDPGSEAYDLQAALIVELMEL